MIKHLKDNQDWLTKIVCSLSYEVGDALCQLGQAQTVEGGPEAEQNCGHLSQEAPPITTQQVQCLVDSWGHMMHMRNLIDLRHSICLFGSLASLPVPSAPVWLLIKYFLHQLFICLPQFVSSKLKVISKISTRWNRDRGGFFLFFFTELHFYSASSLYESQRQLMWPNLATTWWLQCQPYLHSCWWPWQSISVSPW